MTRRSLCALTPALLTVGALLTACDSRDGLDVQVIEASDRLRAVAQGYEKFGPPSQAYSGVIRDLKAALADAPNDPAAGAANSVLADASIGLGLLEEDRARELAAELSQGVIEGRLALDLAQRRLSLAKAIGGVDPSPEFELYREQIGEQTDVHREAQALARELAAASEVLAQRVIAEQRLAEQARDQESELRLRADEADPILRATLITDATRSRRSAEEHERRADEIGIEIEQIAANLRWVEREIDQSEDRTTLAEQATDRTQSVDSLMKRQAAELSDAADRGRRDILARVDALEALALGDLADAHGASLAKYRAALNFTRSADRDTSALLGAGVHLRIARLNTAMADAAERLALLLERAATLPGAEAYAAKATALSERVEEIRADAADAFESAASGFGRGGGASREIAGELERVAASMAAHARVLRGEDEEIDAIPVDDAEPEVPAPDDGDDDVS